LWWAFGELVVAVVVVVVALAELAELAGELSSTARKEQPPEGHHLSTGASSTPNTIRGNYTGGWTKLFHVPVQQLSSSAALFCDDLPPFQGDRLVSFRWTSNYVIGLLLWTASLNGR